MSIINKLIFSITKKPKQYVNIRRPPKTDMEKLARPQDARQMQYNKWCKRFMIYSGSFLPKDHNNLLLKGWKRKSISDNEHFFYQRKSTHQTVRYDVDRVNKRGQLEKGHYHWYVWWKNYFGKVTEERFRKKQYKNKQEQIYYNEFGEKTSFSKPDHHIYSK